MEDKTVDIIDILGISKMLNVKRTTVWVWSSTRKLPKPVFIIANRPVFRRSEIIEWAKTTGRWQHVRVNRYDNPALQGGGRSKD